MTRPLVALFCFAAPLLASGACDANSTSDVAAIMQRVAENQERAQAERAHYLYQQSVLVRLFRGHHKLAREEYSEFQVTPTPDRVEKKLTLFHGKYEQHGKLIPYDTSGYHYKNVDVDGELVKGLADGFTNHKNSKDGLSKDLFPLTAKQQAKYRFQLVGEETYRERPVRHISFEPKQKVGADSDEDGDIWKGDVLIDPAECQPVLVTTEQAFEIPRAVRILLGTNVQQLGFKVVYQEFEPGVWFPVSYSGEFKFRALFLYGRTVSLAMQNKGFQRTDVTTNITYAPPAPTEP